VRTPEQVLDSLKRLLLMAQENPFYGQWVVIEKATPGSAGVEQEETISWEPF
jgi:hypothetical protein